MFKLIRDRLKTELESVREIEARYRQLVDELPQVVFTADPEGRVRRFNSYTASYTGVDLNDYRGDCWARIVHPDDFASVMSRWDRERRAGQPIESEFRIRRADGEYRWHLVRQVAHRTNGGTIESWLGTATDTHHLKTADGAIHASEARLAEAVRAAKMGYWTRDLKTDAVAWSEELPGIFGVAKDDFGGTYESFLAMIHSDDRDAVRDRIARAVADVKPFDHVYRVSLRGEYRAIHEVGRTILSPTGKVVRVTGTAQDITERWQYENALSASEERFRIFMDNCPAVALIKDEDGRFLYVNSTWRKQFFPEPTEWIGKTEYDFWPAETADMFRASDTECLTRNVTIQSEETAVMPSRGEVTWWVMKFPLIEGGKKRVGCIAWDVSDRKRDESTVQLLHRAIEAVPHGIVIADAELPDLPIIYASPAFEQITGYPITETIGKNCRFLQGPKSDPAAVEQIRRGIAAQALSAVELLNYRKDGTTFVNALSISPVFSAGKLTHFVGIASDVTERRNLEDQFRQAQKMEAVGILAGGISHDFNNLLTVILGYCDIVYDELDDGPTREYVREIRSAGNRAATLTRQLLAFSRKSVLEPKALDVNDLVWNMGKLLRRLIGEDIDFVTSLDPNLGRVRADPGQLEQAVMNLCINARDAMPQGGRLTIQTRNIELGEAHAKAKPDVPAGEYVLISVADTGNGMTDEVKSHVFEPFFTTKGPSKGTGLGLALVFGFVQQSGGHIELVSEPEQGAEFKIYMPRIVDRAAVTKSAPKISIAPKGGGETILLVEDEDHVRELTRRILESSGYVILEAAHGRDAIDLSQRYNNPIHLLISDVVMPQGMDGRQVADAVTPQRPEMKVLFVSGFTENTTIHHGVFTADTSFAFLQKPYTPTALTQKVRDVLDRTE